MPLSDHLKKKGAKAPVQASGPVWEGPDGDGPNGGISYSLLTRFLTCKERFRLAVIEGLRPAPSFNHLLDFGSMWHLCEECHSQNKRWEEPLRDFCLDLCRKYPTQQQSISHWYDMCKAEFPIYLDVYKAWPKRNCILAEESFNIPHTLPSGRKVRLRGKFDSVDVENSNLWLWENKTKSQIDIPKITTQLGYDLQVMLYMVALTEYRFKATVKAPKNLGGVIYNVVRRSAHKSTESMLKKIEEDRDSGRITEWFWRRELPITKVQVQTFLKECLNPILEHLWDWWEVIREAKGKAHFSHLHWRHPYGVRNIIDEGGSTDLDYLMDSGSSIGLVRSDVLFPELVKEN